MTKKKESTFFQQQNYDRRKKLDLWVLRHPKNYIFSYFSPQYSEPKTARYTTFTTYVYNRQNFIDEQTKVARCRWEIMQPNGNNSHSSKCREEQKKKDNFSRPQSLFERPLVSEKRFDFSLDLNEVKLFFFF